MRRLRWTGAVLLAAVIAAAPARAEELDLNQLPEAQVEMVRNILKKLEPVIQEKKKAGTHPTLSYDELYRPLEREEMKFLESIQLLDPEELGVKTPYLGVPKKEPELVRIDGQPITKAGVRGTLETQYLPREVSGHYEEMMAAMKKDLGKRLYVASGFRSPAYQLYMFVYYLDKHDYSLRETAQWNALPGYSEHGFPERQAIDFVNEDGVDGDGNPEAFELLPEYKWLLANAKKYRFFLSYPRNNLQGIAFEPWHWHFEKEKGQ